MVNESPSDLERSLALSYAPAASRAGVTAIFALDAQLADVVRTTRDPMVGQLRLTWWFEVLEALDRAPPPAQPVIEALAASVLPHGVSGATIAGMVDGWEALLDREPLTPDRIAEHGERGARLFNATACLSGAGPGDPVTVAGRGWALADLSRHLSDSAEREMVRAVARPLLVEATAARWTRRARALGALTHLARLDLAPDPLPPGAPSRVARIAWHRLTGR